MIRILFMALFLFITLNARENPFFPTEGENDIPLTSSKDMTLPVLKRAAVTLPPQARVLQKVTVEFKNLDGSIEHRAIELENSVDWHLPIFISQSYVIDNEAPKNEIIKSEIVKSVVPKNIIPKNEIVKIETIKNDLIKNEVFKNDAVKSDVVKNPTAQAKVKQINFNKIASMEHIAFFSSDKILKILTKDEMLRNFVMAEPHRIVIDFKREVSFKTYEKQIPKNIFSSIKIGNHSGYYRVVIELDGLYRYSMKTLPEGFLFTLR